MSLLAVSPFLLSSVGMLAWGAAAAAPILIHLWNRRRHRNTTWAAMQYLIAAMKKNSRRIQIEQLLLLILRCAIMLLFALALADISCTSGSPLASSASLDARHTVLVIDGSYSMDYHENGSSRFNTAKAEARHIVEATSQGDGYTLVRMGQPPLVVIGDPAYDVGDVLQEIDALQIAHEGANLETTLAEVEKILDSAHANHPRLTRSRVILFSDLQKTTWEGATSGGAAARFEALAKKGSLSLIDVGQSATGNAFIENVQMLEPFATLAAPSTFEIDIRREGDLGSDGKSVRMFVDDTLVGQQVIDLTTSEAASVQFSHRFEKQGDHAIEFRLDEDALPIDDHRWIVASAKDQVRVLCIAGSPGAAKFLRFALRPDDRAEASIAPEVVSQSALVEIDLAPYAAIFVADAARFTAQEAGVLIEYAATGKGVAFFLGPDAAAENYNRLLGSQEHSLLPVLLESPSAEGDYRFDPRGYEHPLVEPFRGQQGGGLLSTPVWRYFRVQRNETARTALWFDTGDPAIVLGNAAAGNQGDATDNVAVICLPAAISTATGSGQPWSALPTWPSFPPLVQETLAQLVRGESDRQNILVGQVLQGRLTSSSAAVTAAITTPRDETQRLGRLPDGSWAFDETETSGVYRLKVSDRPHADELFAANLQTVESDLTKVARDELPPVLFQANADDGAYFAAGIAAGVPLFRILLISVLALLLLEPVLAWKFGSAAL
ncbi:VWA domain-containing protein [Blastopirellula sp. J2-11]|uniref:VWA domain-containing protein n=1 Tax=Blastopirellula sp. J2-11 TaxID=2943192 RepID=UPI0021C942A2|nr:VWA domain-containing protein [Blastopirellula sp. J2-11]UUO08066.1 VWA domain-containing protein [Blastopirellula sp. J2-11]